MTVVQNSNIIAEREYNSASECVEKMNTAKEYYEAKAEEVEIIMRDKNKALIIKVTSTKPELTT